MTIEFSETSKKLTLPAVLYKTNIGSQQCGDISENIVKITENMLHANCQCCE